jgi:hypothetical protein
MWVTVGNISVLLWTLFFTTSAHIFTNKIYAFFKPNCRTTVTQRKTSKY